MYPLEFTGSIGMVLYWAHKYGNGFVLSTQKWPCSTIIPSHFSMYKYVQKLHRSTFTQRGTKIELQNTIIKNTKQTYFYILLKSNTYIPIYTPTHVYF